LVKSKDFSDHFIIENIAIHGTPASKLVESLEAVELPVNHERIQQKLGLVNQTQK
tara:strand:+ start:400 stop:564 length:165 start_codon:yes stop_codon:yes gene_type:complete